MPNYFVYILKCGDGTLYTGIATDVKRRLSEHRQGIGAKYTRGRGPLRLAFQGSWATKGRALKREAQIKRWPRSRKLQFIKGA